MPRPYSEDLLWRAIWMKEILGFQVDEVAAVLWMSPKTIERCFKSFKFWRRQSVAMQCLKVWQAVYAQTGSEFL